MQRMMQPCSDAVNVPGSRPREITDCHFHVFASDAPAVASARYVPAYAATLEAWRVEGASRGVRRGVVVQPSFLGHDNTALLNALAASPESLRGVAVVAPEANLATLRAMATAGVRALRLNLVGTDHDLAPWRRAGCFERLEALGWHVEVHVDAGRLLHVLRQLPQTLRVVADHFGKVLTPAEAVAASRQRPGRLHVTLSAPYRLTACASPTTLAPAWLDLLGPERLLWASDWPCTAHEAQRPHALDPAALGAWLGDAQAVDAALVTNAAALYGFGPQCGASAGPSP